MNKKIFFLTLGLFLFSACLSSEENCDSASCTEGTQAAQENANTNDEKNQRNPDSEKNKEKEKEKRRIVKAKPLFTVDVQDNASSVLDSIAYDPRTDSLFFIKTSQESAKSKIYRYHFPTQQIDTVHTTSFADNNNYGLRVIRGELYVAQSYSKSISRFKDLDKDSLTLVEKYSGSEFFSVNDMALLNGSLFFVAGHFVNAQEHLGIQYIQHSNTSTVHEFLSSQDSGWPNHEYFLSRSIAAVGQGDSANLVVHSGDFKRKGNIILYNLSGNKIKQVSGYDESNLQVDSKHRIYTITGIEKTNSKIVRWTKNLEKKEEFFLNLSFLSAYQNGTGSPSFNGNRFVLREKQNVIEIIFTHFRNSGNPVFYKTVLPK